MKAVYVAPPTPRQKASRSHKYVRFCEDVRVRTIHHDFLEDLPLNEWLALPENSTNNLKDTEESDSDVSMSSSPPRKFYRASSPPAHQEDKASSPLFFFQSSIFKAFETHSAGAVRCR